MYFVWICWRSLHSRMWNDVHFVFYFSPECLCVCVCESEFYREIKCMRDCGVVVCAAVTNRTLESIRHIRKSGRCLAVPSQSVIKPDNYVHKTLLHRICFCFWIRLMCLRERSNTFSNFNHKCDWHFLPMIFLLFQMKCVSLHCWYSSKVHVTFWEAEQLHHRMLNRVKETEQSALMMMWLKPSLAHKCIATILYK